MGKRRITFTFKRQKRFIGEVLLPGLSLKAIKDFLGNNNTLANSLPKADGLSLRPWLITILLDILNSTSFPREGWSEAPSSPSWQHAFGEKHRRFTNISSQSYERGSALAIGKHSLYVAGYIRNLKHWVGICSFVPTPIQLGGKKEEEILKNFLILPVLIDIMENSIRDTAASRSARSRGSDQHSVMVF